MTPVLDPAAPGFAADPWPVYAALRAAPGLVWHPPFDGWLAARHADVLAIAAHPDTVRDPSVFAPPAQVRAWQRAEGFDAMPLHETHVQRAMLDRDGPDHDRLRRAVFPFFTRSALARLAAPVAARVNARLDALLPEGRLDLTRDLAAAIPAFAIGRLVGTPPDTDAAMTAWSEAIVSYYDLAHRTPPRKAAAEAACAAMLDVLRPEWAARQATPQDDLLSALAAVVAAGTLSEDEALSTALQLLLAGHGSTVDAIGGAVAALLDDPAAQDRLRAEPALLPVAVPELIRFVTPLPFFHRYAARDLTIAGRDWPQGTRFGLLYAAANRDPAAVADPDRLVLDRRPNPHLAFGAGAHGCLGNALSRLVIEAVLGALLARTRALGADGPALWKPGLQARGPVRLPIRVA